MGWVKRHIEQDRLFAETRRQTVETQQRHTELARLRTLDLWHQLAAALQTCVAEYREEYPYEPARAISWEQTGPHSLLIRKFFHPMLLLEIKFAEGPARVEYRLCEETTRGRPRTVDRGAFQIVTQDNGAASFTLNEIATTVAAASRILLEPVLFGWLD